MIIKKANRLANVNEYYLSRKLEEIRKMNLNGDNVINLGIGSPDLAPSEATINSLARFAQGPKNHGYQSYRGIPELRKAIAQWCEKTYQISLNSESEILPLMGSKEGIMHISMAYLNEGDEVLVPDPGYPTYTSVSNLVGAKIRTYEVSATNKVSIDIEQLQKADLSKVKIMWINFPHMPTGRKADLSLLKELVALAKEKSFLLCHDNPYSLILNNKPASIFNVEGAEEVSLELNSFSKSHNMAGWRLGWLTGKSEFLQHVLTVKTNFDSGMFLPIQHAAIEALNNSQEWHLEQNKIYQERKVVALELLDALGCIYEKDQAGLFVWAKVPGHVKDAEIFCDQILQEAKVFMSPGIIFGDKGKNYLRISLCCDTILLKSAINRIKDYLKLKENK